MLPEEADESVYELLDDILHGFVLRPAEADTVPISRRLSEGIVKGSISLGRPSFLAKAFFLLFLLL